MYSYMCVHVYGTCISNIASQVPYANYQDT